MDSDYDKVRQAAEGGLNAEQVLAALVLLRGLRDELAGWEPELIAKARELGTSWADLAPALGVASRQAAERRYLRLRPSDLGGTGDERVQAERDRRAGDRAVSRWARDNSASLRSLAGQVGVHDEGVHDVLGTDDVVTLLDPLANAEESLRDSHPALADLIGEVGAHTDRVRRDSLDRRSQNPGGPDPSIG
jgi:hypothetical protein